MADIIGSRLFGAGHLVAHWYKFLERKLLLYSDAIIVISDDFLPGLNRLKIPSDKVHIIQNWGSINDIPLRHKNNEWAVKNGFHDSFVFLYSGTLGLKHNPLSLCQIADALAEYPSVRVVVSAVGAGANALRAELNQRPRRNLTLKDPEPIEALPDMLGASDVLIALLEQDAGSYSVPSKVLSYLCAGKPILLSAPIENLSSRIVRQSGAGKVTQPGDYDALVSTAIELFLDADARSLMGSAGRKFAVETFDINSIARRFIEVFAKATDRI